MNIPQQLKQIRKEKKITQSMIIDSIGINQKTLGKCENGKQKMSLESAEKYADVLGYEIRLIKKL